MTSQRSSVALDKKAGVTVSFNFFSAAAQKEDFTSQEITAENRRFSHHQKRGLPYQTSYESFQKMGP